MVAMDDVFKTNEGNREAEVKKIQDAIDKNRWRLDKATTKLLNEEIDKNDFKRIKERIARESYDYPKQISDLKAAESSYREYCRYGISLLSDMNHY